MKPKFKRSYYHVTCFSRNSYRRTITLTVRAKSTGQALYKVNRLATMVAVGARKA